MENVPKDKNLPFHLACSPPPVERDILTVPGTKSGFFLLMFGTKPLDNYKSESG